MPQEAHISDSVFVVDLSCVRCIDDLRADDNGVWIHGGNPRKKYVVERDPETSVVLSAEHVSNFKKCLQ